jgi:hypothetical protein
VNMTMYDSNGTETTNSTDATSYVYMVTLTRLIDNISTALINIIKISTDATITVDLPSDVQLSATPLSGYFRIKCVDPEGYESYSEDLALDWSSGNWVNEKMHRGCDRFYDTTEVTAGELYTHQNEGKSFLIRFLGLNADPG